MALVLLMLMPLRVFAQQEILHTEEIRGVWITNVASDVMFSKEKLAAAMDYLAGNGINVVFPVVWNKGVTLHRAHHGGSRKL
ncbi:MAG: family 10 glycosylhydrolase [Rhodothermaceae bacterium]|nr:family 10 glycosylhydrolase [Rhodothermaceae bacterium]